MKRLLSTSGLITLGLLVLASTAEARGPRHGRHGKGFGFGPKMMRALDLSETQRAQIQQLRKEIFEEVAPVREQLMQKRQEMRALWAEVEPDREAIAAKQAEMDPLREQMRAARTQFKLEVHKLLSPDQKSRMSELMTSGGQGCGGHCACGGQAGCGGNCGCGGQCGCGDQGGCGGADGPANCSGPCGGGGFGR